MSEQLVFTYFKVTPFYQPLLKEGCGGVGMGEDPGMY